MTAGRQPPGAAQEGTGPDRIWLEPDCCADPSTGSLWCQDNVWQGTCEDGVPATEYIRADVAARQVAEAIAVERERCAKIAENWKSPRLGITVARQPGRVLDEIISAIRASETAP